MLPASDLPKLTLCTTSALPWSIHWYANLAAESEVPGLELDLSTWIGRFRLQHALRANPGMIGAIWLSGLDDQSWSPIPIIDRRPDQTALDVIVRLPAETMEHDATIVRNSRQRWNERPWIRTVTLAVPATAGEGGRFHLTRLRFLRRLLEEWELDLGIDLTSQTDSRWEAEAVIFSAGPRLSRVRCAVPLYRIADQRSAVLNRTLAALAESGFSGSLALVPSVPLWLSWHRPTVAREIQANRDAATRVFFERSLALREPYESHRF